MQRVTALNLLLDDIYHRGMILRDRVLPADLILGNANFRPAMRGVAVPHKAYVNICGTDIIRGEDGVFRVLEDNARTPSGVSYVIENRHIMLRAFPDLVDGIGLRAIDDYGLRTGRGDARDRSGRRRRSADRAAVARHLQFGLFRARLPGARDGRAAGRGPRPRRRERPRLHAHDRRHGAGST